jgi:hypothetical protein
MKATLDYRKKFLCVLVESGARDGSLVRKWYPVREAKQAEVRPLLGREVVAANSRQGVYTDEEGNVFQLASSGETKPVEAKCVPVRPASDIVHLLEASLRNTEPSPPFADLVQIAGANNKLPKGRKRRRLSAVFDEPVVSEPTSGGLTSKFLMMSGIPIILFR